MLGRVFTVGFDEFEIGCFQLNFYDESVLSKKLSILFEHIWLLFSSKPARDSQEIPVYSGGI